MIVGPGEIYGTIVMFLTLFLLALTSGAAFVIWLDFNPSDLSPTFMRRSGNMRFGYL
jgi:hypothetical protein